MCKRKATVTLFVSLLNMCICVSDVTLSVPCHRTHARAITIMLEILWRVTFTPFFLQAQAICPLVLQLRHVAFLNMHFVKLWQRSER